MNRKLNITTIIGAAFLVVATPAIAERKPTTMGADARVTHVTYNPTDVIRVHTHLRVNTAIELGNGERITQVLLGDSESFEVEVLSNRQTISIKPVIARASSNMTVYTNRRAIAFYVTEGSVQRQTFRVVVNFPDDRPRRTVTATGSRDTGYQFSGNANFRPVRVWNDGRNTFFEFRNDTRPSIFRVNASGYEVTTNTSSRRRVVRVSGVHSEYSVRIGNEVVCIRRIQGGTVSSRSTVAALAGKEF
ncbi:TrbG/VirB9 family P-type conjugative transfer protein [Tropicibacter sp. R15_0]|uniref:TrbG/VirB9 family P-type conjugative transfer protein n=1 Tax=Tropicibacter sp. R15_0 TaxID=2821101 RepID=UPI001ADCF6AA|nr:TrbG/VirB9 family P-type conjugative transfer protein [Tropicibacter sp. R15_0]MBO9468251.1 TrbG/VirB9 family P-type conjugative transfer protein [Tropicibacter sp. R15_0]